PKKGQPISVEGTRRNFSDSRLFFQPMAAQQLRLPGWEEMPNVNRNDHTDYSHYRFARRLQWHRGRTVLWHLILWRRRPRAHHRHPADPAPARTDLARALFANPPSFGSAPAAHSGMTVVRFSQPAS